MVAVVQNYQSMRMSVMKLGKKALKLATLDTIAGLPGAAVGALGAAVGTLGGMSANAFVAAGTGAVATIAAGSAAAYSVDAVMNGGDAALGHAVKTPEAVVTRTNAVDSTDGAEPQVEEEMPSASP